MDLGRHNSAMTVMQDKCGRQNQVEGRQELWGLRAPEDRLASPEKTVFEVTAKGRWVWLVGRSARQGGCVCESQRHKTAEIWRYQPCGQRWWGPAFSHPHSPACSRQTLTTPGVHVYKGDTELANTTL